MIRTAILTALLWVSRVGNVLIGGNYMETMSSRAHRARRDKTPCWSWTAGAIDTLFFWQPDHCRAQWAREVRAGWHE